MVSKGLGEHQRPSFMLCTVSHHLRKTATMRNGLEGCAIKTLAEVVIGLIIMYSSVVKTVSLIHYSS